MCVRVHTHAPVAILNFLKRCLQVISPLMVCLNSFHSCRCAQAVGAEIALKSHWRSTQSLLEECILLSFSSFNLIGGWLLFHKAPLYLCGRCSGMIWAEWQHIENNKALPLLRSEGAVIHRDWWVWIIKCCRAEMPKIGVKI